MPTDRPTHNARKYINARCRGCSGWKIELREAAITKMDRPIA
jgi:hypothetical protein